MEKPKRAAAFLARSGGSIQVILIVWLIGCWAIMNTPVSLAADQPPLTQSGIAVQDSTTQNKNRAAAQQAFEEAEKLRTQATAAAFEKAIKKYEEALPVFHSLGDKNTEATIMNNLGESYYMLGQHRKAFDLFNQALPIFREIKDLSGEAGVLTNIGTVSTNLGDNKKALQCYEQAVPIFRSLNATLELAFLFNNMGVLYTAMSDYPKAADSLNEALPLVRKLGDKKTEAAVLNNLASSYHHMGKLQTALDIFKQSLIIFRAVGDKRGEGNALQNIGSTYGELGEPRKQMDYYEKALPVIRATGDRNIESNVLNMTGVAYANRGDSAKARRFFEEVLSLRTTMGNRPGEAETLQNLAAVLERLGERQKALGAYNKSLSIREEINELRGISATLDSLATFYAHSNDLPKARDFYARALQIRRDIGDRAGVSGTLHNLAKLERSQGDYNQAYTYIKESIEIIESSRRALKTKELRASYSSIVHEAYETNIDILMQLHKARPVEGLSIKALQSCETGRARSLLEMLIENRADLMTSIDKKLRDQERTLRQQLNAKGEQQLRLLSGKPTPEQKADLEREVRDLTTLYEETLAEIRAKSPPFALLTESTPLSVEGFQREVLDQDTLLLEYALGEERSYLWAVAKDSITSYELPSRKTIEAAAQRFTNLIIASRDSSEEKAAERLARHAKLDQEIPVASAELSQLLLAPVVSLLGNKRLLIVPDGILHYVPFAALAVLSPPSSAGEQKAANIPSLANYQPLITKHAIVSLPSAAVLTVIEQSTKERATPSKTVAIFADPVFDKTDTRVTNLKRAAPRNKVLHQAVTKEASANQTKAAEDDDTEDVQEESALRSALGERSSLARLYFSRDEAEAIYKLVKDGTALKKLDFDANIQNATAGSLGQYKIVHFSTHGILNSDHPELSGIVLSLVDKQGKRRKGFLGLSEIFTLKLPVELVTLSACQTALGKEMRGEGLVGLTRGFMYAGAKRVVASLWSVQDAATARLMTVFYSAMLSGQRADVALRNAQVMLWQSKKNHSPYYWAGFILQGEWR